MENALSCVLLILDIMGFVKTMGKLEDFNQDDATKSYVRMTLCDTEYVILKIMLMLISVHYICPIVSSLQ